MTTFRDLRRKKALSQVALGRLSGLRQATISAIERGQVQPQAATIGVLAKALACGQQDVAAAWRATWATRHTAAPSPGQKNAIGKTWRFLTGLDQDLRLGLVEALVTAWTHTSTALEGNTLSQGDTLFVLREGLTVSGHSLREHEEIHGHAQAVALIDRALAHAPHLNARLCHEVHRMVQTGVHTDALAPIGKWKVQPNGTQAISSTGGVVWHDYAAPEHVPALMQQWLKSASGALRDSASLNRSTLVSVYAQLHLGFTAIHPYADGNGRVARLLANLPLLHAGYPPLMIAKESRRHYLQLIGDFSIGRGAPVPGQKLVPLNTSVERLCAFFHDEWQWSLSLVDQFHERQKKRR
ncbi:MAG: Fic family protein [Deltaproteobacteria bacterium]|nr:Fic family protein [Deltaproteobacteria bacterium]